MREELLGYFNQSIVDNSPVVLNVYLDEDESQPWIEHFDPSFELIFGKNGLSERLWRGNSIFDSLEGAPEIL